MQTAKQKLKRAAPWLFLLLVLAGLAAVRGLAANYEIGYEIMNGDFQNYNPVRHLLAGQVTLANLTSIGRYASVFGRSLLLAAEATIICLVLAFPVGYFLSRLRANKQHIMLMLVMLPMWMNFLLRTYAWMTLLEKNGLINKLLSLFGIGPFNMINTSGAVVLGMVYNYLPYMILPLYTTANAAAAAAHTTPMCSDV